MEGIRYIELAEEHCSNCDCGLTNDRRLHIHHIDHNRMNNEPSNRVVLCQECHRDLHFPHRVWNRQLAKRLRTQGYTFEAIGKIIGLTRQRIHQLCRA